MTGVKLEKSARTLIVQPLPGIGDPADLARLMAWLLSDKAGWITGQVWEMDGGFSSVRPLVK